MMSIDNTNFIDNTDFADYLSLLEELHECPICLESFNLASNNLIKTCCNHFYCKECYNSINNCGLCRTSFNKIKPTQPTNFRLNFNHPEREIIYVGVNTINGLGNQNINIVEPPPMPRIFINPWTNSSIESDVQTNIQINTPDRFSEREGAYFNYVYVPSNTYEHLIQQLQSP